jgi:hypothetical protein
MATREETPMSDLTSTAAELPIDALTEADPSTIGRGDTIAYVLSKTYPEQVWRPCRVVANDSASKLIVVAMGDNRFGDGTDITTLEWKTESVAQWPDNQETYI